jgi:acetyl-CoA carboxylase carboxyltransferase component
MTRVLAELQGTVAAVAVVPGQRVRAGQTLLYLEAMKMEHPVTAPFDGVVTSIAVAPGDPVKRADELLVVEAGAGPAPEPPAEPAAQERDDLAEVRARHDLLLDDARPEAVRKRHEQGRRTARENLADLVDDGSWVEYGGLAVAARRAVLSEEELRERTPADGFIAGLGTVDGQRTAVAGYDYLVLAGTQGYVGHRKKDRLFDVVERTRTPVVLFAEGGGGRPGDTDYPVVSGLDVMAFRLWAGLTVPRIGIASGYCFAGNAGLYGCCDITIATEGSSIGMGGPAMIEGAGLGRIAPGEVGSVAVHASTGVVDIVVRDDQEAVQAARRALSYFRGGVEPGEAADQASLRSAVPTDRKRAYDVRVVIDTLADRGSVLELGAAHAPGLITALARIDGTAVGLLANNCAHLAGAITGEGADKAARFLTLCETFRLPVVSLIDTPGIMVGPEAEATGLVRQAGRLFTAGARLTVPHVAVILRKAYGLGAQAMAGGTLLAPLLTVAWPTGELGAMGVEGAVNLALRRQLDAAGPQERERMFDAAVNVAYERGRALSAASFFELDDVIDPAGTRRVISAVIGS